MPLRSHGDETDSNFIQLLNLWAIDTPGLGDWMKKITNKYSSHDIQNEVLHIMALIWYFKRCQAKSSLAVVFSQFWLMNTRMLPTKSSVWCALDGWIDHENVIGVYNVGTIDAKTLTDALEDVLLRAGLKIHNC